MSNRGLLRHFRELIAVKNSLTVLLAISIFCLSFLSFSCGTSTKAGSVDSFKSDLQSRDFSLQEGKLEYFDLFAMSEAGLLANANYNNAGVPYLVPKLPLAPGQTAPPLVTDAPINPANKGLYVDYRIRPDEAIVLVGQTPPKCAYFGFDGNVITRWSEQEGTPVIVFANYGDALNQAVIRTDGPADDPYQRNTMIIVSADKGVAESIRAAAQNAGYADDIINDYPIPSQMLKLGLDGNSDTLALVLRFAYPEDTQTGQEYLDNANMQVFRVTPNTPPESAPFDLPTSRVRGTGDFREFALTETAEQLRQSILTKYGNFAVTELVTTTFFPTPPGQEMPGGGIQIGTGADVVDGLVGLQENQNLHGPGRDALYLGTTQFTLADNPNEFVIVYGINHAAIGRATYASFSVYGPQQANGVVNAWNGMYEGTAEEYLPGNPNAKYFYVWKIARQANGDPHTTEVPFDQGIYGIDLDKPMFVGFRLYLQPETMTGPIATETYFDRVIKFSGKT